MLGKKFSFCAIINGAVPGLMPVWPMVILIGCAASEFHRQHHDNGYAENGFQHGWSPSIWPDHISARAELSRRGSKDKDKG